jgi:hypothetical protein
MAVPPFAPGTKYGSFDYYWRWGRNGCFAIGGPMTLSDWKDIAGNFQSTVAPPPTALVAGLCLAVLVGGLLAFRRYRAKASSYAHIETALEIAFLGQQDGCWIVELKAILANKGNVQRRIHKFRFDLNAIHADDPIEANTRGQVSFTNEIAKGSFVPRGYAYCVVGPTVTATYSYVARVPEWATFLMLHCWFDYNPGFSHLMKRAVQVPRSTVLLENSNAEAQFAASSIRPRASSGAGAPAEKAVLAHRWGEARELRDA